MILVVDNFDSFVHNLARYFRQLGVETKTVRNDQVSIEDIRDMQPQAIVLSPGPCTPDEAGISLNVVTAFLETIPILGVCLGHQAIVQAMGGNILRSVSPVHGRSGSIIHDSSGVFEGLPTPMTVGRYHSLIADAKNVPGCLEVTATLDDGTVMAVRHNKHAVVGLQFHPESILTDHGYELISGFLRLAGIGHSSDNLPQSLLSPGGVS
ncbi:MAG: aminodeoxychorismate/anthranilate synthase component II [Planctomycetota bacterium]